jgi:uncharacterized MnhB-related membrane protein
VWVEYVVVRFSCAFMSSPDDAVTWAAVLGCMAFYVAALAIERLGVALLHREAKVKGQVLSAFSCVVVCFVCDLSSIPDDAVTWGAVLGCMMFYVAALAIERLGVALLRH